MSAKISKTNINVVDFIRSIYKTDKFIPLHEPRFQGNEKKYLNECINSTFVSSVGKFVDRFEIEIAKNKYKALILRQPIHDPENTYIRV